MDLIEKIGENIGKAQVRAPNLFLLGLIISLIVIIPGTTFLLSHVEPSLEKTLPQNVIEVETMNDMRTQFGADMMQIIIRTNLPTSDIRTPKVINYVDTLSQKLRENDYILQVDNIADIIKAYNNGVVPKSLPKIKSILHNNPYTKFFINYDYSTTIIQIKSDTGADSKIIKRVVEDIEDSISSLETKNPGVETEITGFNSIDKATFEVIIKDFMNITGLSFLFMLIFLLFYFKSIRKVIMSLSVIMISLLLTAGITGYLAITMTVVTMVAGAMIMALGISYGINVTYEYYVLRKEFSKKQTIIKLNTQILRALVGSSLTTGAGFLALLFGVIPAMKNLGIVLAIGIVITLFVSVLFLPVIIIKLDTKSMEEKRK